MVEFSRETSQVISQRKQNEGAPNHLARPRMSSYHNVIVDFGERDRTLKLVGPCFTQVLFAVFLNQITKSV